MSSNTDALKQLHSSNIYQNLTTAALVEHAIRNKEGSLSKHGAFIANTEKYTGRSPNDKFIVKDANSQDKICWGDINRPIEPAVVEKLKAKILSYLSSKDIFVQDCYAGANPKTRLAVRVITQRAWHNLFARNMFISVKETDMESFYPEFSVIHAPGFKAQPDIDGTNSEAAIIVDFTGKEVIICGTEYAGEIKKSIFSVLNYVLPLQNIVGMHCSANIGTKNDTCLFFGLSGTGKTTLSADPSRSLIGDDEHGWDDEGIFNFEGGCYAKVIKLKQDDEPEIFATTKMFGTVLENVVMDKASREIDFDDAKYTENTRCSYDIHSIKNIAKNGCGGHPKNLVMLTCDAFGVLPPIAKLNHYQVMYHFLSGYTAKIAGTERGVKEPSAVFSACFGAPFMPLHPGIYAKLLGEKIQKHNVTCWLVNTGWSGGGYGIGKRMSIKLTRALLGAALRGDLNSVEYSQDPIFNFLIPQTAPGVESAVLNPKNTWNDKSDYEAKSRQLVNLFQENFKYFMGGVSEEIINAGPQL